MHEVKKKTEKLCELERMLVDDVQPHIQKGVFCEGIDGEGVGKVVDMIKDLCEAEEKAYKAQYYKKLCEKMTMEEPSERAGYDHFRYSSGRFAPKGRGHYSGYTDNVKQLKHAEMHDPIPEYNAEISCYPHRMMKGKYGYPIDERYGMAYNDYSDAKRYYHESKDQEAKKEMGEYAKQHLHDILDTTEEIWEDAKPETRREFKEQMMKFLKDMPTV